MDRYAVSGSSDIYALAEYIRKLEGQSVVCAQLSGQVFATLTEQMIYILRQRGNTVLPIRKVQSSAVSVPKQIYAKPLLSGSDTLDLLGLNKFKFSVDPPLTGAGFIVAIIGTGIHSTHVLLENKVIHKKNFTNYNSDDTFDHETGIASLVHAIVPDTDIVDLKVLGDDGSGTEESVVMALEYAAGLPFNLQPNIINMSLGSPDDDNPYNPVRVACRAVMEKGIVIVAAAGNSGSISGAITVPACEPYIAAVGSTGYSPFVVSKFSSRGPTLAGQIKPDTVFIGEDLIMASSKSDSATVAKSGTSFSVALVAGVIIMTMEGIERTHTIPPEMRVGKNVITNRIVIENMLPSVCTKPMEAPVEKDNEYGYGVPVGSLTQSGIAGAVISIDINATIALSVTMMMMQLIAGMVSR